MFEFLRSSSKLSPDDQVDVFGRSDPRLSAKMNELYRSGAGKSFIVTEGFGKDSGALREINMPESIYISALAEKLGVPATIIRIDTHALNGGENARNSLTIASNEQTVAISGLTALAHAASLRRLANIEA